MGVRGEKGVFESCGFWWDPYSKVDMENFEEESNFRQQSLWRLMSNTESCAFTILLPFYAFPWNCGLASWFYPWTSTAADCFYDSYASKKEGRVSPSTVVCLPVNPPFGWIIGQTKKRKWHMRCQERRTVVLIGLRPGNLPRWLRTLGICMAVCLPMYVNLC